MLVHVGQFYRFSHLERSAERLFNSHDESEQGGFTHAVGADYADDTGGRQRKVQVLVQQSVAVAHRYVLCLDHHVAETGTVGDEDFEFFFFLFGVFVEHFVVSGQARFAFRVAGRRGHAHPFQFALERFAAFALLLLLLRQPVRFLFEPAAVITLPRNPFATVQFQNPTRHVVEEIAVVGDGDHRSLVLLQVLFEPVDAFGVEVVGRFVEQQHVGLLQQQTAQCHPAPFAARKVLYRFVGIRTAQCVHRPFERGVELPAVLVVDRFGQLPLPFDQLRHLVVVHRFHELRIHFFVLFKQCHYFGASLFDHFPDGFCVVQLRFLFEIADCVAGREDHFALEILFQTGDDFH